MSPSLGNQQNYSAYLLLGIGIISIFADCKFERVNNSKLQFPKGTEKVAYIKEDFQSNRDADTNCSSSDRSSSESSNTNNEVITIQVQENEIKCNPYDIPEDF